MERKTITKNRRLIDVPVVETATTKPISAKAVPSVIKHVGGGWYEVNGVKVQGREKAEELASAPLK